MATPLYVDPAKANDAGDGTTPATAKKTVLAAYAAVDDGGSVYLLAGSYTEATQGAGWYLNLATDKGVTIKPDPSTAPTITLETAGATRAIYWNAGAAGKTVRIEGVSIPVTTGTRLATLGSAFYGHAKLINCTLACGDKNISFVAASPATRTLEIDGCTIATSAEAWITNAVALASLNFTDNIFATTSASTSASEGSIVTTGSVGDITISGNTITATNMFLMLSAGTVFTSLRVEDNVVDWTPTTNARLFFCSESLTTAGNVTFGFNNITVQTTAFAPTGVITIGDSTVFGSAKTYTGPIIVGNRIEHARLGFGNAIRLSAGCLYAKVVLNECVGWYAGVRLDGCFGSTIDGNYMSCGATVLYMTGGGRHAITHNHLIANDYGGGADVGRCILHDRLVKATSTSTTTFTSTKVTDAGGTPWGGAQASIAAGLVAMVNSGTSWYAPLQWGRVVSITGNEVTVDGWWKFDGTQAAETPANGHVCKIMQFPLGNILTDNVFDAGNATYTFTFDFIPIDPLHWCDRNLYRCGTDSLTNLASHLTAPAVADTLAELRTAWSLLSVAHPLNDANSQEIYYATPRYINNSRWWRMPGWSGIIAGRKRMLLTP